MKTAKPITRNLFNVYMLFTREPFVRYFTKEQEFYTKGQNELIGLISLDFTDNDYYAAIFSRDKSRQYRAEKVSASLPTIEDAREWIDIQMSSDSIFMHDDKTDYFDLFDIKVSDEQLHPHFKLLNESEGMSAAKSVIQEVSYHYKDIDGNFTQQFQSINVFDSRLWELYLFCFCREEFFSFKRNSFAPDILIEKLGHEIAIEAVTVSRIMKDKESIINYYPKTLEDIHQELENEMPLRFGSALFDKLKKKYWELEHIKGKPFIIAIADFHETMSMIWSFPALTNYLYGFKHEHHYDEKGELIITPIKIKEFIKKTGATVSAGFFFQPDSENISAVLFSSTGTISKFNRMGKQAGLGSSRIVILRMGMKHNHDKNASIPDSFMYKVTEDCKEMWSEGVSIYHNPNAKIPLNPDLLPSVAHHFFKDGQIHSFLPEFYPYSSFNQILIPRV
jgi:hypothetical protein